MFSKLQTKKKEPKQDTQKIMTDKYPLWLRPDQPLKLRQETVSKLENAFQTLGPVLASEKLTDPIFKILIDQKVEVSYRETVLQALPPLIKILMKHEESNEITKSRCLQTFIQPLSELIITDGIPHLKASACRIMMNCQQYLDDEYFKFFLLPILRGNCLSENEIDTSLIDLVISVLARLSSEDYQWISKGIETLSNSEIISNRIDCIRMIISCSETLFDKDAISTYIMKTYLKLAEDKSQAVKNEFVKSLPSVFPKVNEMDGLFLYERMELLFKTEKVDLIKIMCQVLPLCGKNIKVQKHMKRMRMNETFKQFSMKIGNCYTEHMIKLIPILMKLFPNEESFYMKIITDESKSENEENRFAVACIFKDVFHTVKNKKNLVEIFEKLAYDTVDKIKTETRLYISEVMLLDNKRFFQLYTELLNSNHFRIKFNITKGLRFFRNLDFYEDTVEKLIMSRMCSVRDEAINELGLYINNKDEVRSRLYCRFIVYMNGSSTERQALAYTLATIAKGSVRYEEEISVQFINLLKDPIPNVRISVLNAIGLLKIKSPDIRFFIKNTMLRGERDAAVYNLAEKIYLKLC